MMLISHIETLGRKKTFQKGSIVFLAGDESRYFYLLISGEVRIYKTDQNGKQIEINRIKPHQLFAEAFVLADLSYLVSAETTAKSDVIQIKKSAIFDKVKKDPVFAQLLVKTLANRCIKLNQSIEDVSLDDLPNRLKRYLHRQLDPQIKGTQTIMLPISKKQLASQLGTIPETLSRAFEKLQTQGLIKVSGKTISILSDCCDQM